MRKPTRVCESSETTIDLICVNNGHRVVQWEVINTPISDHSIVLCVLKSGVPKLPPCTHETRSYKNYRKQAFVNDLRNVPWNVLDATESIDDALFLWNRLFSEVADLHAPIKRQRMKGFKTPWVNSKLLEIRRDRDFYHRKARKTNSQYYRGMYKKLRNCANREERKLKSAYFCQLIEDSKSDGIRNLMDLECGKL